MASSFDVVFGVLCASRLADASGRLDFPFAITAEMKGNLISRIGEFYDTRTLVS